ncbi:hypothetical protein [Streptomyces sp. NPDC087525]|uniref:hypothetical protein n=1 Tax=Streptomyces sp. NPDC087525 TaxID=3365793 RepID=UPI0037F306CD
MSAEMWTAVSGGVVGVASAVATYWGGRSARRTRRQENRDDFTTIVKELRTDLTSVKADLTEQKAESARQAERITDQDLAIGWLLTRVRGLVTCIRQAGLEPPPAEPVPDRARQYIHHIDA